ncbi:MAG: Ig-like domain-containing protein, partial [Betaproteobacteria bacterium]
SATGLVVNPKLITQPAVGVKDTYVVTMNNSSGSGTTLATVVVSRGSVKIDSILMASEVKIDSIVMSSGIITPILSGFSLSAASVAFGTTTMPIITAPTSASSGAISYAVTGGTSTTKAVISSTGVISAIGSVGTTIITATQAADGNYATASTTATLTVTTTPSFTNFGAISKTYGDAAFDLIAPTSASSGAFTYTSSNPLVATISGSTVTVVGAGTSTITATQEANGNYAKANTTATLTVKKATPILTDFLPITKTLVDTPFNLTAPKSPSSGGFTYTYSIDNANGRAAATVTSLGKVTIAALGSSTITAIQAADANYLTAKTTAKITVTLATPIITNFPSISKDLFDPLFNITDPKSTSDYGFQFTSSNKAVAIISGHEVRIKGVGTTTITAYQDAFGNYTDGSITATITVNRAPITTLDSGGLTWTRNNRTAGLSPGLPGTADWATANATCNTLTLDGFSWRLPTHAELTALYAAGTGPLTAAGWIMHSVWSSNIYTYNSHNVFNFFTGPTPFPFPADYGMDVGFYHVSCVHP